jgi:hypothetical protein
VFEFRKLLEQEYELLMFRPIASGARMNLEITSLALPLLHLVSNLVSNSGELAPRSVLLRSIELPLPVVSYGRFGHQADRQSIT